MRRIAMVAVFAMVAGCSPISIPGPPPNGDAGDEAGIDAGGDEAIAEAVEEAEAIEVGPDATSCTSDADCKGLPDAGACSRPVCRLPAGVCELDESCDDGNPCTADSCDTVAGRCVHQPVGGACDDGDACTVQDECNASAGECVGIPVLCDDHDPCTKDLCSKTQGCISLPDEGAKCDDGNPCSVNDRCTAEGKCEGGAYVVCNDGNPCTADLCDVNGSCKHPPLSSGMCSDGNACTTDDSCVEGKCEGGAYVMCSDGNPCTMDTCDPVQGCVFLLVSGCMTCETDQDCPKPPECWGVACDPGSKTCVAKPADGGKCEDGDPCTTGDGCKDGTCAAGGPASCDDHNPCTLDTCDPAAGGCMNTPQPAGCDDGDPCTRNDFCNQGVCMGDPVACDDGNPCTDEWCDSATGTCATSYNANSCDDGDSCTIADACSGGLCLGKKITCDDGDPCTVDSCAPGPVCKHAGIVGCLSCTSDTDCNDTNPCTEDMCVGDACKFVPVPDDTPCDDGNRCTAMESCQGAVCLGGLAVDCTDGNPCTDDYCSPSAGCLHKPNSAPCQDDNPCTVEDQCKDNQCMPGPTCDDHDPCTDGMCVTGTACPAGGVGGVAAGGKMCCYFQKACDDQNVCTFDWCDAATGNCATTNNSLLCGTAKCVQDGTWFFVPAPRCTDGSCASQPSTSCDDKLACTTDTCSTASGCQHLSQCHEPNPDCTAMMTPDNGCACAAMGGVATKWCDPARSDHCDPDLGCRCGTYAPCTGLMNCCDVSGVMKCSTFCFR